MCLYLLYLLLSAHTHTSTYIHTNTDGDSTYFSAHGPHFVSVCVWLFRVHGVNVGPETEHALHWKCVVVIVTLTKNNFT